MSHVHFFVIAIVSLLPLASARAQEPSGFTRIEDVIYERKAGVALTMDVIQPTKNNNGHAIIHMVSGGWFSSHDAANPRSYAPYLDRGYTVFAVVHGSQPKLTIPEVVQDIAPCVSSGTTGGTGV